MYLGKLAIDDLLTFAVSTHRFDTGAATDADAVPTYRVYEDETAAPLLTGSMALLDGANTAGLYSEQIALSAANGFEVGKSYTVYITAAVNSVSGVTTRQFHVRAAPSTAADIAGLDALLDLILEDTGITLPAALALIDDFVDGIEATLAAGVALTAAERNAVADALLNRNIAGGSSTGRLVKEAFYRMRNRVAVAAGTATVYGTDDSTPAWTATVATAAGNPVSEVDPA